MKTPRIVNAVGHIDDDLVSGANREKAVKKNAWLKWGCIAACFAVMLMAVIVAAPMMFGGDDPVPPVYDGELYLHIYVYYVDEGVYSTYVRGKVISEDKIGDMIADVSVTAGWINNAGEWISAIEKLRGEVYAISGVSDDVAVALKFIDKGEALTTTHYYVIMNPNADLTAVEDYIITSDRPPNNPGDEIAGAVSE